MEREGEGREMKRRGREMRRRGIVIGGMVLGLLLGCNNGEIEKLENKNKFLSSVVNLGNEFLNVFTSFGDMVGGVLGFNATTKKSDVGAYFKKIQDTVQGTKDKLIKIVADMKEKGNPNASKTETVVNKFVADILDNVIQGSEEAIKGVDGDDPIANVAGNNGAGAVGTGVEDLVKGLGKIVNIVLKGKGKHNAGDSKQAKDGSSERNGTARDDEAGKLFASGTGAAGAQANAQKVATDAAKAVGAVTGADILQAMIQNDGDAFKLATAKNASAAPTDGIIAGAIALRAMAKDGKFGNSNNSDVSAAVKDTAVSAVNKVLDTLTIAIRKTIDKGLKEVKEAMKINSNDNPITSETNTAAK